MLADPGIGNQPGREGGAGPGLHGQSTYNVADALIEAGLRFVFVTGYDTGAIDPAYRDYPRCEKPFQPEAIIAALASALVN